jgi:hypothetical protein
VIHHDLDHERHQFPHEARTIPHLPPVHPAVPRLPATPGGTVSARSRSVGVVGAGPCIVL